MSIDIVAFILKSRGMRHMTRFQNTPRIKENNVAEHTGYVAMYTLLIWRYLDMVDDYGDLLSKAILHDVHEGISVEMPQNVKRFLRKSVSVIEDYAKDEIFKGMGEMLRCDLDISPIKGLILKCADIIDALVYSCEEYHMGNKFFLAIIKEIKSGVRFVADSIDDELGKPERKMSTFIDMLFVSLGIDNIKGELADMDNMTHIARGFCDG